ncbi:MAG: SPOR domain-containing protein [Sphingomonadales bacterium]|nr:SPOR domain-containing protein [Sphingomonadales bacterium]MDE2569007.1 SPOR domain-containing protein [Sphingomonadales bacterium]
MTSTSKPSRQYRMWRGALSTAFAAGLLSGCAAGGAHPGQLADRAQNALGKGDGTKAVGLAEQAVQSDPRNAAFRATLGDAYLRAGRFASARQAYDEAMQLGDDKGRTALSLALADIAQGRNAHALDTLVAYRDSIPASDYGLAVALAGQPSQGVAVLANLLRGGEDTAKVRQNLAYAYALDGKWAMARIMVAQDVPANLVDDRLTDWALNGKPEDANKRVAMLLKVPEVADSGEPQALALANTPSTQQLADDAAARQAAPKLAAAAQQELPAIGSDSSQAAPAVTLPAGGADTSKSEPTAPASLASIDLPPSETAPVQPASYRVVGDHAPARSAKAASVPAPARSVRVASAALAVRGTHLVQLGAFSSQQGADRAWAHFIRRSPALNAHGHVITHVVVNGHDYWRVMAEGFSGYANASSLCNRVKSRGGACFVRLDTDKVNPRGGQVETRMARR